MNKRNVTICIYQTFPVWYLTGERNHTLLKEGFHPCSSTARSQPLVLICACDRRGAVRKTLLLRLWFPTKMLLCVCVCNKHNTDLPLPACASDCCRGSSWRTPPPNVTTHKGMWRRGGAACAIIRTRLIIRTTWGNTIKEPVIFITFLMIWQVS